MFSGRWKTTLRSRASATRTKEENSVVRRLFSHCVGRETFSVPLCLIYRNWYDSQRQAWSLRQPDPNDRLFCLCNFPCAASLCDGQTAEDDFDFWQASTNITTQRTRTPTATRDKSRLRSREREQKGTSIVLANTRRPKQTISCVWIYPCVVGFWYRLPFLASRCTKSPPEIESSHLLVDTYKNK